MECVTCKTWLLKSVVHPDDHCAFRASLVCRRCCCAGHATSECTRITDICPNYIEDLIPLDVKNYYDIRTKTAYHKNSTMPPANQYRVLEIINDDKWIRAFLKKRKIATTRKREDNLATINNWAAGRGLSIVLVND